MAAPVAETMRFVVLAFLALALLPGGSDRPPRSEAPAERLPTRLNGLDRLCADAASDTARVVRCTSWLPRGEWDGRALRSARCEYLLDLNRRSAGRGGAYHALMGGRCGKFSLRTRRGRWPAKPRRVRDLGLIGSKPQAPGERETYFAPVRLRVLRRASVGGRPALLLVAGPYPAGGIHGGHIAAVWNQHRAGYALTLHFAHEGTTSDRRESVVLRAARSMSRHAAAEPR